MIIKGQGIFKTELDHNAIITVRALREFTVLVNDEIVAPNNALDRYAQINVKEKDIVEIIMDNDVKHTIVIKELPNRGERPNGESMCEVIDNNELSMYDRLRSEMLGLVSQYAEAKGMDTWEEDNDFDMEDDEEPLIATPYEYKAMIDEQPIDPEIAQNPTEEKEIREERETVEAEVEEKTTTKEE